MNLMTMLNTTLLWNERYKSWTFEVNIKIFKQVYGASFKYVEIFTESPKRCTFLSLIFIAIFLFQDFIYAHSGEHKILNAAM